MSDIKRTAPMGAMGDSMAEQPIMSQPQAPKKSGLAGKVITVIIVIVVILIGLFLVSKYTKLNILGVNKSDVSTKGWQAVFLTNGQVYFGKIAKENDKMILLQNIYYLQVAQSPQPAPEAQAAANPNNVSLVKLGNELHGPTDEMKINMSQVLFTESMKSDSKVVDAIVRYLEDQKK